MDDPRCEYGLRGRWAVVQSAVGSEGIGIVFHSPSFDEYLGLPEGVKDLSIKHFVSEFTVETFTVAVFPRATRFDVQGSYSRSFKPLANSLGGEFRAVIRSDVLRWTMGHEEIREAIQYVIGAQPSLHHDSQALPTEFVDDRQNFDGTAIVRAVCHEIIGPDMVAGGGPESDTRPIVEPKTSWFGLLLGNFQPPLTPDTIHLLMVDLPTLSSKQCRNPAIAVASTPFGKLDNCFSEYLFGLRPFGYESLS